MEIYFSTTIEANLLRRGRAMTYDQYDPPSAVPSVVVVGDEGGRMRKIKLCGKDPMI